MSHCVSGVLALCQWQRLNIAAVKSGKRVYVGGMALAATTKGTFDTIDGEFDPSRNELAVTGFTYGDFQEALGDCAAENVAKGGRPILNRIVEIGTRSS